MKIVVFGATGKTGLEFIRQALEAGHEIVAFVRNPTKLSGFADRLSIVVGNMEDASQVAAAIRGQDAVVSCLGPSRPMTKGFLTTVMTNITTAMRASGVRRLVVTGGTIQRDERDEAVLSITLFRWLARATNASVLEDLEGSFRLVRTCGLDWTVARFPLRLTDSPLTLPYRTGFVGRGVGSSLPRATAAAFLLEELGAGRFLGQAPVVSA